MTNYASRNPRLPIAESQDVPAKHTLSAGIQNCSGGNPCALCLYHVADVRHTLHRCADGTCICHDAWRLVAADWDALVRCGRKQILAGLVREEK